MRQRTRSLEERLRGIAGFLPVFLSEDFEFGIWESLRHPGTLPTFTFSDEAAAFVNAAYDHGWVLTDFDWSAWQTTSEAERLCNDADALSTASADQLAKLLTLYLRGDRFCEGALASAYESGLLTGIVRRASSLEAKFKNGRSEQ